MSEQIGDAFADTVFWVALIDRKDQHHGSAVGWSQRVETRVFTTDAVLTEVANCLSQPNWRSRAVHLVDRLSRQSDVKIVSCDHRLWSRGFELYRNRPDKGWSLTDCLSFVVMEDEGLKAALTADAHFQQAGFRALLLESL